MQSGMHSPAHVWSSDRSVRKTVSIPLTVIFSLCCAILYPKTIHIVGIIILAHCVCSLHTPHLDVVRYPVKVGHSQAVAVL